MGLNEYGEAAIHYNRAITLDPEIAEYYLERAKCYEIQGLQQLAQEDYKYVLKLDPTYHLEYVANLMDSEAKMDTINASNQRSILDKLLP
jgi:tetratricopeptide (TPR) repeat protein